MTQWFLIVLGGFLGSSHCLGMCGGFAAIIGMRTSTFWGNFKSQMVYSFGRITSYASLGGLAGFTGRSLSRTFPQTMNIPAILSVLAGLFLVYEGLNATGIWRGRIKGPSTAGCMMAPIFSTFLRQPGTANTYLAGLVTGLLPCGLVYAFISLAGSSADLLQGMWIMAAFGSGTIPLMVATGCGFSLLSWKSRQRLWKVAAWSVLLTGLLTLYRGIGFFQTAPSTDSPSCPFCAEGKTQSPVIPIRSTVDLRAL